MLALVLCLVGALVAAIFWRDSPAPKNAEAAAPNTAQPVSLTPEQILSTIPDPDGKSVAQQAVAAALVRVRENHGAAAGWARLGDALAQIQRESDDERYFGFAELAYQRALELEPGSVDAFNGMAWVTGGRHQFPESVKWAERALTIDPNNATARGIMGDAALELGDYDEAFAEYQTMMDLRPDLSSWSRGAHLLWLTGNRTKALWLMEKAIKAGGPFAENTAWCRARLALMHFENGAYEPAASALAPALENGSRNPHILLAAGRIAAARQDHEAARKYYKQVLAVRPNHEALVGLGDLSAAEGDQKEAEKFYRQVEELHDAHLARGGHDHMAMAKFYADHDRKLVQALRLAEEHKLTRNVLEADVLAWVYFKNGDLARAREAMVRALRRGTPLAEMQYHAGMIAAAAGDHGAAQKALGRALNFNPKFSILQGPVAARTFDRLGKRAADPAQLAAGR